MMSHFLLLNNTNGSVHHGKVKGAATSFGVCKRTVHNVWKTTKSQISQGIPVVITAMKGKPKKKHLHLDIETMKQITFEKRSTMRRLARELGVSKSQVERWLKEGLIKAHTNDIHPELTLMNKLQRIKYSLNALVLDRNTHQIEFSSMHHVVHINEK
ncbi:hypothetical protein ACS0TY_029940 [Phlomoides rotata]